MDIDLDDLEEDELKELQAKIELHLHDKKTTKYPYGKPENNLKHFIKWMETEFFEKYEDALSKTDYKAISFFTEYLNHELDGTGYEDMRASLEQLDELRTLIRKMLMNADPENFEDDELREIEDFINEEGSYSKERGYQ